MSTQTLPGRIDLPDIIDTPDAGQDHDHSDAPPDFGRCPVCGKALRPHDPNTGQPRTPPVGRGFSSRARCGGCGTVLYYRGGKEWGVLLGSDLTEEDKALDKLRW